MGKKLKGAKELQKVVNNFTKTFGVKAKWGTEFEALPSIKEVHFTVVVDADMDEVFLADAEARYPKIHAPLFAWLLMHEIGHCMTDYLWTSEDEDYFEDAKNNLDEYFGIDVGTKNEWYHKIGDEYMATKWAGEYMIAHPKKMRKFCESMNKAMKVFCKKNAIAP